MSSPDLELVTIGHSAHPIERFLSLLQMHGVQQLVDVRSVPGSRFHPQYNQRRLESALQAAGIRYLYLGDVLGGRPTDPTVYPDGKPSAPSARPPKPPVWERVMERDWFQGGIEQLLQAAGQARTVILCSEEDPARCHRHHLIAAYLSLRHPEVKVLHVRGSGEVEPASLLGFNKSP